MYSLQGAGTSWASMEYQEYQTDSPESDPIGTIYAKIFDADKKEIFILINPLIPKGSHPDFTLLNNLIIKIFDDPDHQAEEIAAVFIEISRHPSFPAALCSLVSQDPRIFVKAATTLPKESSFQCLGPVFAVQKESAYFDVATCIRTFLLPCWDGDGSRTETFDCFLGLLGQEAFEAVAQSLVANLSLEDLGRLLSLTEDEQTAFEFIQFFVQSYRDQENFETALVNFVEAVVRETDKKEPKAKPVILVQLLDYEDDDQYLSDTVLESDEQFSQRAFGYVLWCLREKVLKKYLKDFSVEEDSERLISFLDLLIELESDVQNRIKFITHLFNEFSEDDLQLFLTNMLLGESKSIPYLCPAMSNEAFQVFALVLDPSLRTNLLRRSLTSHTRDNREIVTSLAGLNGRHQTLCSLSVMDIVSQNLVQVGDEQFGKRATLQDFAAYIALGQEAGDLEDKMAKTGKDFAQIPPILLALAMRNNPLRGTFVVTLRYMTDDQLTAFAQQVPKGREVPVIDQLMDKASYDQMNKILSCIPFSALEIYLKAKGQKMHEQFQEIREKQESMKAHLQHLLLPDSPKGTVFKDLSLALFDSCVTQSGQLRGLLSPLSLVVRKHAKEVFDDYEVDNPEELIRICTIVQRCEAMQKEVEEIVRTLQGIAGGQGVEAQRDFDFNRIPIQMRAIITLERLRCCGITYEKDIKCLGISLEDKDFLDAEDLQKLMNYLSQSEQLREIWTFFRQKKLCTISDLLEACLVESPTDLLDLLSLAKKMGL